MQKINKHENIYRLMLNKIDIQIVEKVYQHALSKYCQFMIFQNVQQDYIFYPIIQLTLNQKQKIWYQTESDKSNLNNRAFFLQKQYIQEQAHKYGFINKKELINTIFKNEKFKYNLKQMFLIIKEEKNIQIKYVFVKNIISNLIQAMNACLEDRLFYKFGSKNILVKNDNNNFSIKVVVPYFVQKYQKQDQVDQTNYYDLYESYLIKKLNKIVDEIILAFKQVQLDELQAIIEEFKKSIKFCRKIQSVSQKLDSDQHNSVKHLLHQLIQKSREQDINKTELTILSQIQVNQL
ncbi:hypothetical protein ABPG73_014833 [Tetrahymena malaccensis]